MRGSLSLSLYAKFAQSVAMRSSLSLSLYTPVSDWRWTRHRPPRMSQRAAKHPRDRRQSESLRPLKLTGAQSLLSRRTVRSGPSSGLMLKTIGPTSMVPLPFQSIGVPQMPFASRRAFWSAGHLFPMRTRWSHRYHSHHHNFCPALRPTCSSSTSCSSACSSGSRFHRAGARGRGRVHGTSRWPAACRLR